MARPASLWKVLAVVLIALLAMALGVGLWVASLRDRRWAAMENRVRELRAGLDEPPLERVPLGREVIPGNAWEDCLVAIPDGDYKSAVLSEISLMEMGEMLLDQTYRERWLEEKDSDYYRQRRRYFFCICLPRCCGQRGEGSPSQRQAKESRRSGGAHRTRVR